jgi:hypothetical protein
MASPTTSQLPKMHRSLILLAAVIASGCSLLAPSWHWEKAGGDYDTDIRDCKTATFSDSSGAMPTTVSVRRMQACMEGKGWKKVAR